MNLRDFQKNICYFFLKDTDSIASYQKMLRFFLVQIFFWITYLSFVLSYGISSSASPEFWNYLSGANAIMFLLGLLNWQIIKNFQNCHSNKYKNNKLLKIDLVASVCILPFCLITKPIFFWNYKKENKAKGQVKENLNDLKT